MPAMLSYVLVAVIAAAHEPVLVIQEPAREAEARLEAARRAREIMEMRQRMADRSRAQEKEALRLHNQGRFTHPPKNDLNMAAEPNGGWTILAEFGPNPNVLAESGSGWSRFVEQVSEFLRLAEEISYYRFAPMSEPWALEQVEQRSRDLQERTEAMLRFLLDGRRDPVAPAAPAFDGLTLDGKVAGLDSRTFEIRPKIVRVLVGETIDVDLLQDVVERLTEIEALARAVQE